MSLDIQLKGKRILLKATVIYGGKSKVPKEKEKLKLQYRIAEIIHPITLKLIVSLRHWLMVLSLSLLKLWKSIKKSFEMDLFLVRWLVTDASCCQAFGVFHLVRDSRQLFMSRDTEHKTGKIFVRELWYFYSNQILQWILPISPCGFYLRHPS